MRELGSNEVSDLANGKPEDRAHLNVDVVRKQNQNILKKIEELLALSYNLTYLEGVLYCDDFHEGKNSFDDLGETYGYINSFVRRDSGTNCFRFSYRRPLAGGKLIRQNIPMKAKGYTLASFKRAAHDYEKELALMTEEHYSRLRAQGKTTKEMARKLRAIKIFAHENDE